MRIRVHCPLRVYALLVMLPLAISVVAQEPALKPGQIIKIKLTNENLPPTLYSIMKQTAIEPCVTLRLPDDFDAKTTFPLLVYVPGNDGGREGNLGHARTIAGDRGWIVASLPLFKKTVDPSEPAGGVLVSFEDEPIIARAYAKMLGKIFEMIPRIDKKRSAMVGFSNGSLTIAVLVSCHDDFILSHFRNFCLVDHGMFHLSDLHKREARECRYLILAGDREDMGRSLKIRGGQLQRDEWNLLGIDLTFRIMKDTGHEFGSRQMALVAKWLRHETLPE